MAKKTHYSVEVDGDHFVVQRVVDGNGGNRKVFHTALEMAEWIKAQEANTEGATL